MGNIAFGDKYFIFTKFSSIPKTSKIEKERANLRQEYDDYTTFANSKELKNFLELEKYLNSEEHKELMASIKSGKSKEQEKIKLYETWKKSKKFKNYFKFKDSPTLKNYLSFQESKELNDYQTLEKLIQSEDFASQKMEAESVKNKEDQKIHEFNSLKKTSAIKNYFKFKTSSKLKEFNTVSDSAELKRYSELEKYIKTSEFTQAKHSIDPKQFSSTDEGKKEREFENLKKSAKVKFYFKFKASTKYNNYLAFEKSAELKKFLELEDYLNTPEHKKKLSDSASLLAGLIGKEKDFQQRKKSASIKNHFKFQNSHRYKDFVAFEQSKELADYLELEEYLSSDQHRKLMKSLDDREQEESEKVKQYEEFKNSKKYKWYLSVKDSNKFDELTKWKLVFDDDFTDKELNTDKWMTRYFWGDRFLKDAYALDVDKAFPTDGKNLEVSNSSIKIITRKEKTEGKVWKQPFGFIPQEFDYTTGLISTAKSFRQKFGKFEAKIKINYAKPVNYNFWMVSEKNLPHVDILKLNKKKTKIELAHHTGDLTDSKGPNSVKSEFAGLDVTQDYFIYTLLWTSDKLTWKINDVIVYEQKRNIPNEEMYLVFSSSIAGKVDDANLPASLEIDWVRCYKGV